MKAQAALCVMKTTQYFNFRRILPDRMVIKDDWIASVIRTPLKTEAQEDGRMRLWGCIDEMRGRVLRVVLLEDGETVHNAFFDRNFKE
jgi:hypothetical protein